VANPRQVKLITESSRKDDRLDAQSGAASRSTVWSIRGPHSASAPFEIEGARNGYSFVYSVVACLRTGISGSASFHSVRNTW